MKITVIAHHEFDSTLEQKWSQFRTENPHLASPYFSPQFFKLVGDVRNDVYLSVIEDRGQIRGFFPFQKGILGTGGPVAGALSDYQGMITDKNVPYTVHEVVDKSGLRSWHFDHLLAEQFSGKAEQVTFARSPAISLQEGFESYEQELKNKGSDFISHTARKIRNMEKDIGPLRFQLHTSAKSVLEHVILWKNEQCRASQGEEFLRIAWIRNLIDRIFAEQTDDFRGVLTALYAGDNLVAAHFGMRSKEVLHWWFPVYNHQFQKYSPGSILLLRTMQEAHAQRIALIDLGKGEQLYKSRVMNTSTPLVEGYIATTIMASGWHYATSTLENTAFKGICAKILNFPGRLLRKWKRMSKFR